MTQLEHSAEHWNANLRGTTDLYWAAPIACLLVGDLSNMRDCECRHGAQICAVTPLIAVPGNHGDSVRTVSELAALCEWLLTDDGWSLFAVLEKVEG